MLYYFQDGSGPKGFAEMHLPNLTYLPILCYIYGITTKEDNSMAKNFNCSMQKKIESLNGSKSEALEDVPEEVKTMVKELAEETGNDFDNADVEQEGDNYYCVTFKGGSPRHSEPEYICFANWDDAEAAAVSSLKDIIDDIGIDGFNFDNIGGIEQYVNTEWFDDAKREYAEFYVSDIKESEPDRYKEEFGDLDEEDAVEKYLSGLEEDSVKWYMDDFGKADFNSLVKEKGLLDYDKLAQACVDADGPANELASYDGAEIELPCGYYCYRRN